MKKLSTETKIVMLWKLWTIVLIVGAILNTGCITIEGDEPDVVIINDHNGCDAGVTDTDAATTARLHLVFGGPPSGSEIAVGASNVDTLCFQAWALDEEIEIRKFRLYLRDGDGLILNSTVQYSNIKVADTGGPGGIVAGPVNLDPGGNQIEQLLVLNASRTVPANSFRTFCVRVDVGSNEMLNGHGFGVMLMPFEEGDVVLTSDGSNLPVEHIDPADGLWTDLVVRGNAAPAVGAMTYALAPDDAESQARQVIGGTTAVLAKIRFVATGDDLKLTKVRFRLTDVVFDPSVPHGVAQVTLWDGVSLIAGPAFPNGSGYIDFSNFAFAVPRDTAKTLTVKATLNQVGPTGADSGIDVGVTLCAGNNDGTCWAGGPEPQEDGTYEVRSATTNVVVDTVGNPGNIQGRAKILRKTTPTVTLAPLPSSTLSNGTQTLARFTITADTAGDLSVKSIAFEPALNDTGGAWLAISSPTIREVGQGTNLPHTSSVVACTTGPTPELATGTCHFSMPLTNALIIPAGQSRTYEFRAVVAGADATGETISTKLLGDTARVTGSISVHQGDVINGTLYQFIWSDMSAIPHNDLPGGSADWTNGHLVRGLTTDAQTLVRN